MVEKLIKRQRGLKLLVQALTFSKTSGETWRSIQESDFPGRNREACCLLPRTLGQVSGLQHSKTVQGTRVNVKRGETGMVPGREAEEHSNRLQPEFYASEISILLTVQSNSSAHHQSNHLGSFLLEIISLY
ncbi:hypothetical protein Bca52824_037142 [Brassica carinata]|uniref:Uncharacterized protein n=1 Tax=Brassica carinata TaxID=52824 RepID=A0A8X7S8K0_BRACI|nr:hypothetical protein Bca52824_037142 [Brassica carinata]